MVEIGRTPKGTQQSFGALGDQLLCSEAGLRTHSLQIMDSTAFRSVAWGQQTSPCVFDMNNPTTSASRVLGRKVGTLVFCVNFTDGKRHYMSRGEHSSGGRDVDGQSVGIHGS